MLSTKIITLIASLALAITVQALPQAQQDPYAYCNGDDSAKCICDDDICYKTKGCTGAYLTGACDNIPVRKGRCARSLNVGVSGVTSEGFGAPLHAMPIGSLYVPPGITCMAYSEVHCKGEEWGPLTFPFPGAPSSLDIANAPYGKEWATIKCDWPWEDWRELQSEQDALREILGLDGIGGSS